ncbi:glycoside hydrolase family 10 protein [Nostoc sp. FACHB-152]|uniref:glycoside hydrolase family 10 protein n=1 Tax=unclassified Nostoc TaxID=2593658 RepID=UPI0016865D39|nr:MULTISPECIES: glycoside hydrolase family 10 protein [unclassified Nostoc]MBD2448413.1 glycoside hydrolase family 10 protein [Nostoc sp. FACHB-152]MBD2470853.1 glycoside hydrolase family 10 protein [Nostoc sp. FACHB-145]
MSIITRVHNKGLQINAWVAKLSATFRQFPFIRISWHSIGRFLPVLFAVSFTAVVLGNFTPATAQIPQSPRQEIRGVWLTNNDFDIMKHQAKVQETMAQLRQLNFNTVYPLVWNDGYTKYPSEVAQQLGIPFFFKGAEGQDVIADIISQSRRQGLLAIPWFEFGFMVPLTSELASARPNWLTQKQDGTQTSITAAGEVAWFNPFHPEVQKFITDLVVEVITKYNADGIQFDDHMSLPVDFGYDSYTIKLYTEETGNPPPSNPQAQAWVQWRADKITAFMQRLHQAVKQRKPNAIFSVSPNYYDFAYKFQLQDWLNWMRLGIIDELVMQVYRNDLDAFISQITRPEIVETQQYIPTGIGIMAGLRNRPVSIQQIQSQVQAAQARGLGAVFFYYESLWEEAPEPVEERQAGFLKVFANSALRDTSQITRRQPTFDTLTVPLYTKGSGGQAGRGYYLEVSLGGDRPRRILLDTGSAGLRVTKEFLGNVPVQKTGQIIKEVLSDGTILEGELVYTTMRIGLLATEEPIPVQVVTSRKCIPQKPNCSAKGGAAFSGIIGVNYSEKTLPYNLLRKLPGNLSNGFIVTGNGGSNNNGSLTLGLTEKNRAGFKMASLKQQPAIASIPGNRWDSRLIGVCLTISGSATKNNCNSRMVTDTTARNGFVEFKSASLAGKLKSGRLRPENTVKVGIPNVLDYSLVPGNRDGFNAWNLNISKEAEYPILVNSGIGFFDKYDVLFDSGNGQQGFRVRN